MGAKRARCIVWAGLSARGSIVGQACSAACGTFGNLKDYPVFPKHAILCLPPSHSCRTFARSTSPRGPPGMPAGCRCRSSSLAQQPLPRRLLPRPRRPGRRPQQQPQRRWQPPAGQPAGRPCHRRCPLGALAACWTSSRRRRPPSLLCLLRPAGRACRRCLLTSTRGRG